MSRSKWCIRAAMFYMLNRWETFTCYLDDGAIPIDNNRTEAALKDPIIGRKNWLFFQIETGQTETGGQTAAILYSLTSTCKRLCIDVYAYLNDLFHRLPSATVEELEQLLPDNWLAAHPQHLVQQRVTESIQAAEPTAAKHSRESRHPSQYHSASVVTVTDIVSVAS